MEVTTCKVVAKAGYRIGDRVVRAAQVLVVDPVDADGQSTHDRAQIEIETGEGRDHERRRHSRRLGDQGLLRRAGR